MEAEAKAAQPAPTPLSTHAAPLESAADSTLASEPEPADSNAAYGDGEMQQPARRQSEEDLQVVDGS